MDNNPFVIQGKDGKPIFIGKEDPNNRPSNGQRLPPEMECPVCHSMVDYLVGENTPDGGRQGCEKCWKPGKGGARHERQIQSGDPKEIVFD